MLKVNSPYPSHHVIAKFMHEANPMLNYQLQGGHMDHIFNRSHEPIERLMKHTYSLNNTKILKNPDIIKGAGVSMGGAALMGGSGAVAGSLHLGGSLSDNRDAYHFVLELNPREFEMLREIAVQILGGKPSPMWGRLADGHEPLEAGSEDYQNIIRMPNTHSAGKLLDAEYGYGKGGGFGKAFRHVARIGAKIAKAGHHVLKFVDRNKDVLLRAIPEEYRGEAEAFLETANRIDDAVNPIVDATLDAVKPGATQADKNKLKKLAENKIKEVIEDKVPNGKEILRLAEDINQNVVKPIYAQ